METGRLSRSWVDLDTAPFVATDQSYEYDEASNVTRVSDAVPSPDDTQCFGYDYLRRLTGAWTPSSGDCETAPSTQDLGGPAGGQQSLVWDHEGRLQTVTDAGGTTRYIYDADGNRLISREPDGKTLYLPGQEVRWDEATDSLTCTRFYEFDGRTIASRDGGGLTWLAGDHQGTALVAIEEQGQQVSVRRQTPFGVPRGSQPTWPNQKGFVGGDVDPNGLVHLGAREYDPVIGRFISVDPLMDLADPQQMHGYAYANNNPVTWADPSGLMRACVEYCGSDADLYVNPSWAAQQTGPVAPGRKPRTLNQLSAALGLGPYDRLAEADKVYVQELTLASNHPEAYERYKAGLPPVPVEYTLFGEFTGANDADRCLRGQFSGCARTAVGFFPPVRIGKWGKPVAEWLQGLFRPASAVTRHGDELAAKANLLPFCSFSGDTPVLMADGTTKPISEVVVGDEVFATDPETGQRSVQTVVAVWVHEDILINLVITPQGQLADPADSSASVGQTTVTTTADHPFWNHTDQQWQPATALDPGDRLLAADGTRPTTAGLLPYTQHTGDAYNLTTTGPHTYHVLAGTTPILVHNTGCDEWAAAFAKQNGGEVKTFVGPGGQDLPMGPYRPKGSGTPELDESWFHHTVVVRDGKVYDQWHPQGIGINEYKTRFDYWEDIDFGF